MSRNRFGIAAVALAVFATGTPLPAQRLQVTERWATKGEAGREFGNVAGMAEARNGDIWIADDVGNAVLAVSAAGRQLRTVAKRGKGPGEVEAPTQMVPTPAGEVAVYDFGNNRVQMFNAAGTALRTVRLQRKVMNPKGFAVSQQGEVIISGGIPREDDAVHTFDREGRLVRSVHRIPQTQQPMAGVMVAGGPVLALSDGSVLFSQAAPHRILLYPPQGDEPRVIAADPKLLEPVGDDFMQTTGSGPGTRTTFDWWFPQSKAIFRLADGRLLNVVRIKAEGRSIWELYSPAGKLLSRTTINRAYEPWALTRNGDVLASYLDPETDESVAARLAIGFR